MVITVHTSINKKYFIQIYDDNNNRRLIEEKRAVSLFHMALLRWIDQDTLPDKNLLIYPSLGPGVPRACEPLNRVC